MAQVQRLCCPILVKLWHTFACLIGSENCMWTTCELNESCATPPVQVVWNWHWCLYLAGTLEPCESSSDSKWYLVRATPKGMTNRQFLMSWAGLAHYTSARRCQCLPMFVENKIFPWRVDSTQQTMLVVTRRLCRSGHVDWWVQRRALSTTCLKTVYKYCRMVLCLSAALVIYKTAVYWQRASQHTLWQAPYILRYCC